MNKYEEQETKYSAAVRLLVELDYDLSGLYAQHQKRLDDRERGTPTALDLKYALNVPTSWAAHFDGGVPYFGVSTLRVGGQLLLTSGQRKVLNDMAGLTPTRTITILDIDFYPGTTAVRTLTIGSNLHVPDHKRKHVLSKWTLTNFGEFMQLAHDAQVTINSVKVTEEKIPKGTKPTKITKTLEEMYKDYV